MWLPALASVTAVSMVVVACTARPASLEWTGRPGEMTGRAGRAGIVVAAPHGTSDLGTGAMAAEIARLTGFGLVVATDFTVSEHRGRRYHVNRPMEGVAGHPASEDVESEGARAVYEAYERRVREVAQGPLAFYVEIHGNSRAESADRVEIATVGVDAEGAQKLRTLFELVRDAHLRVRPPALRLPARVEPADPIVYTASGAKRAGILRLPQRALHIELPRVARQEARELYTLILADFLREAIALPLPARR
jgi:hypothetical protein